MKSKSRQSQSLSREGRREVIARSNRLRATLKDVSTKLNFGRDYGEWEPGGNPAGYFTYSHFGYEIRLRYSQKTDEWTAKCPHLKIETSFPHTTPQDIQQLLNDWLLTHTERPTSPEARLRQSTTAVQQLAQRHRIPVSVADELMLERGF